MKIKLVEASYLPAVPVTPLPFLKEPTHASVIIVKIETDNGITGYGATELAGSRVHQPPGGILFKKSGSNFNGAHLAADVPQIQFTGSDRSMEFGHERHRYRLMGYQG
jgi:hypothetical protein